MKHKFNRDEDGEIDYEVGDFHYGPVCLRCFDSWCYGCEGSDFETGDCPGDDYEFPGQFDLLTGDVIQ